MAFRKYQFISVFLCFIYVLALVSVPDEAFASTNDILKGTRRLSNASRLIVEEPSQTLVTSLSQATLNLLAQQAYIKASNTETEDYFGISLAISGETLVIGAPHEDSGAQGINGNQLDNTIDKSGAVYVFERVGGNWVQKAYLKASNAGFHDSFGGSVDISGDTIVVGAVGESSNASGVNGDQWDNSVDSSGAAYVFVRSGNTWVQQAYLKASNPRRLAVFGWSVAISGDTIVVGAQWDSSSAIGVNGKQDDTNAGSSGAAYVFVRAGGDWTQQAYLKASNTDAYDYFGSSVGISSDTIVIGAPWEGSRASGVDGEQSDNSAVHSGAAYVFVRTGGNWSQEAYLKASNTGEYDLFGGAVAIEGDTIVIGASEEDSGSIGVGGAADDNSAQFSGAAYVFFRTGKIWTQQAYLKASNTENSDFFGFSVDISGETIVVGATGEDSRATGVNGVQTDNSIINSGAVYVFGRNENTWTQQDYIKASTPGSWDGFGRSVAISNQAILVGASDEGSNAVGVNGDQQDNSAKQSGAGYVFNRSSVINPSLFQPYPDGYGFRNWGGGDRTDLTLDDLRLMFSDSSVCISTNIVCVPRAQVLVWLATVNRSMQGGHCFGMATSAARFFSGSDLHEGYLSPYDLGLMSEVQNNWTNTSITTTARRNIAFYHAFQWSSPIREQIAAARKKSPTTILNEISLALSNGVQDTPILLIYSSGSGHAITPYEVKSLVDGIYKVFVYDNNYPNDFSRFLTINTNSNTWTYDLGGSIGYWYGGTGSIGVISNSQIPDHLNSPWFFRSTIGEPLTQTLTVSGEGEVAVMDGHGRIMGIKDGVEYDQIPEGYSAQLMGGLGEADPIVISIPNSNPYLVMLSGKEGLETKTLDLVSFGVGSTYSLENLQISASTDESVSFDHEGSGFEYQTSGTQAVDVGIAIDDANVSWGLTLIGTEIQQGSSLLVNVNPEIDTLILKNDQTKARDYDFVIKRLSTTGSSDFVHYDIQQEGEQTHFIRFGDFKDSIEISLGIDTNNDGVPDNFKKLNNQANSIHLPLIIK